MGAPGGPDGEPPVGTGGPLLRVRELRVEFDGAVALADLDLDVSAGRCVVLVGHNGCGKSTAVRCLGGHLAPTGGTIEILGHDASAAPAAVDRVRAVVPDPSVDLRDLTVRGRLERVATAHRSASDAAAAVDEVLEEFGLHSRREARAHQLSLGLEQRAQLASAFVRPFELLIVDEPTRYLDLVAAEAVVARLVAELDRGCGAVLTSHDPDLVLALADEVIVLEEGRPVARGNAEDVLAGDAAVRAGLGAGQ